MKIGYCKLMLLKLLGDGEDSFRRLTQSEWQLSLGRHQPRNVFQLNDVIK